MSDNPIVLTLTIYPAKKNQRKIAVTGAPEGEMPLLLEGVFAERHALLDQAFTAVLKRDPQIISLKTDHKAKTGVKFGPGATVDDDDEAETETADPADAAAEESEAPDAASGNISNATDADLPAIDGDTTATNDDDEPVDSPFVADDLPDDDEPAVPVADTAYFAQPASIASGTLDPHMAAEAETNEE